MAFVLQPLSASFDVPEGQGVVDDTGTRWLLSPGKPPASAAASLGDTPPAAMYFDGPRGFSVLTRDRRLLSAKTFLDELAPAFAEPLPAGAIPQKLHWFRGGFSVVAAGSGEAHALVDGHLKPLTPPEHHVFADVLLAADGSGVAVFLPEEVGITTDFGKTWKLVPLPGALASELLVQRLDGDDERAIVWPGGVRDGFPRSVDPKTGVVERAIRGPSTTQAVVATQPNGFFPPNMSARGRRPHNPSSGRGLSLMKAMPPPGIDFDDLDRHAAPEPAPKLRFTPPSIRPGQSDGAVTDGDDVLVFGPTQGSSRRDRQVQAHRGRLGEGVTPVGEPMPPVQFRGTALCGSKTALLTNDTLILFQDDQRVANIAMPHGSHVTFAPDGTALVLTHAPRLGQYAKDPPKVTLFRVPVPPAGTTAPEKPADTPEGMDIEGLGVGSPTFEGGCHSPAIWVRAGSSAAPYQVADHRLGEAQTIDPAAIVHGVNHQGALVVSTDKSLDLVGQNQDTSGSFPLDEPISSSHLSFSQDGRYGLWVARSGQVSQTDDGGRSFRPIASPAVTQSHPVLCGQHRCQLGTGIFREGFERGANATVAAWPPGVAAGTAIQRKRFAPPVVLTCSPDTTFTFEEFVALTPRIDRDAGSAALFFAGAGTDQKAQIFSVWGDTSGKIVREKLRRPPMERDRTEVELVARGTGAYLSHRWRDGDDEIQTALRWGPGDSATILTTVDVVPTSEHALLRTDGAGLVVLGARKSEAMMWGKSAPTRRPINLLDSVYGGGTGFAHVEPDGTWSLLQLLAESQDFAVRVDVLPSDQARDAGARSAQRTFSVASSAQPAGITEKAAAEGRLSAPLEIGAGIGGDGPSGRRIVLWERTADGGDELRIRPLVVDPAGADVSFGPAKVVPNTHTKPGELLVLPSCAPSADGVLVRLETRSTVRAKTGKTQLDGPLVRLLRVTDAAACVERTFLAQNAGDLAAHLVLVGNGELGASENDGSVKCEPVKAIVPPGEELKAPKPPGIRIPGKK